MKVRLPLITTIATYVLMILGELVVSENAGFVCPDWPQCNGKWIPTLSGLVLLEYTHRLVTVAVTVLVLLTCAALIWKRRSVSRTTLTLGVLSVVFLFAQAAMGALIVVLVLPGAATTIDVGISYLLLGSLAALCGSIAFDRSNDIQQPARQNKLSIMGVPVLVTGVVTLVEVLVGAYFRHSGQSEALFGENSYLLSHGQHVMPAISSSMAMLFFHIVMGVGVLVSLGWLLMQSVRQRESIRLAGVLLGLTVIQMILGFVSYGTQLSTSIVTLHWSVSALIWSLLVSYGTQCFLAIRSQNNSTRQRGVIT